MTKKIAMLAILLCMASASSVLARGYYNNHDYYGHRGDGYHRNGLGIAVGVMGGLILGSALISAATPQPPVISYGYPETTYQQQVVVQRPRICVEERIIHGEWQISRYNGRRVWVSFPYPVTQNVQVPCY